MAVSEALASLLAYLDREAARRAEGKHPGVVRLRDDEIVALTALIRNAGELLVKPEESE